MACLGTLELVLHETQRLSRWKNRLSILSYATKSVIIVYRRLAGGQSIPLLLTSWTVVTKYNVEVFSADAAGRNACVEKDLSFRPSAQRGREDFVDDHR